MEPVVNVTASFLGLTPFRDLPELLAAYSRFNGPALFEFLSKILHLLSDPLQNTSIHRFAEQELFSPGNRAQADLWRKTNNAKAHFISRQQLLCALKFVAMVSPTLGGVTLEKLEDRYSLGELLSQTSEFFPEDSPPGKQAEMYDLIEGKHKFTAQFLSRYLLETPTNFGADFARFHDIFFEHLPQELVKAGQSQEWLDILFLEHLGVTFEDCFLFALIVSTWTYSYELSQLFAGRPGLVIENFSNQTTWSDLTLNSLIDLFSCSRVQYGKRILRSQSLPFEFDFEVFRDAPMQREGENLYVLDSQFLIDCIGDRLLHRLVREVTQTQRNTLSWCLGRAFESYCLQCLESAPHLDHKIVPLTQGSKVVDIEVQAGKTRIFVEVCKSNWGSSPRYSGDPDEVATELNRLDRELSQLALSIAQFLKTGGHDTKEVIPVLVGMDRSLGVYFVQYTLNKLFQKHLRNALKGVVTNVFMRRLVVMNADDYQSVCQLVANGRPIKDLLHALFAEDPEGFQNVAAVYTKRGYVIAHTKPFNESWRKARERIKTVLTETAIEMSQHGQE